MKLTLTPAQAGYIAGVLDAKGHLSIIRVSPWRADGSPGYQVRWVLRMRDRRVLKAIAALVPGAVVVAVHHQARRQRPDFKLRVPRPTFLSLLETVAPYLHRQRSTVRLMLRLAALRRRLGPLAGPEWTRAAAAIYRQFRALERSKS